MAEWIVIGGGVVGLGIAWQLALKGVEVVVFEREHPGCGASGAAAGMLAPTSEVHFEEEDLLALGQLSLSMYPDFVSQLQDYTGLDVDYRQEGTLVIGLDRDDGEALKRLFDYQKQLGLGVEWLSGQDAQQYEPALSPNVHSAVYCASDHQVDPSRLVRALHEACLKAGVEVRTGEEVTHIVVEDDRVRGVELRGQRVLHSEHVLVAAGAWSRQIGGLARRVLPHVRPVRGQMLSLDCTDQPLCTHVIRSPDAYLVPKSDGRLIIGATMEEMGFDSRLTAGGVFELLRGAWEAMPGVYDAPILDMWTGFRPMTLNNLPVLGPSTQVERLWFATGHGRNGILLAAVTAFEVAKWVMGENHSRLIEKFR